MISTMKYETVHGQDVQQSVTQRTKETIIQKYQQYLPLKQSSAYMNSNVIFEEIPKYTAPYAEGKLKKDIVLDGIHAVNWARYLAGVPDDIEPDWSLEQQEQAAALVNALNGGLSHTPSQPKGMDQSLFNAGFKGAGSSNLSYGRLSLYDTVLFGYMSDNSASNIDRVGHRRWVINPAMTTTMFGYAFKDETTKTPFSSMYAFDQGRAKNQVTYDYISWPSAGYFPDDVFATNDPWSVSLNVSKYDNKRTNNVRVVLTRISDNKTWNFSSSDNDKQGKYFNVETSGYGIPYCIIFRPNNIKDWKEDDRFKVDIRGIYNISGQETSLSYETTFFKKVNDLKEVTTTDQVSAWAISDYTKAKNNGIIDSRFDRNYQQPITRQTFAVAGLNVYEHVLGKQTGTVNNPFTDVQEQQIAYAYQLGLIKGTSPNTFSPQKTLTRQEAATILVTIYEQVNKIKQSNEVTLAVANPFKDNAKITPWARENVYKAVNLGLMNGLSNQLFEPSQQITHEQAYVTLQKLLEKLETE